MHKKNPRNCCRVYFEQVEVVSAAAPSSAPGFRPPPSKFPQRHLRTLCALRPESDCDRRAAIGAEVSLGVQEAVAKCWRLLGRHTAHIFRAGHREFCGG